MKAVTVVPPRVVVMALVVADVCGEWLARCPESQGEAGRAVEVVLEVVVLEVVSVHSAKSVETGDDDKTVSVAVARTELVVVLEEHNQSARMQPFPSSPPREEGGDTHTATPVTSDKRVTVPATMVLVPTWREQRDRKSVV
mgnify:FL=1